VCVISDFSGCLPNPVEKGNGAKSEEAEGMRMHGKAIDRKERGILPYFPPYYYTEGSMEREGKESKFGKKSKFLIRLLTSKTLAMLE
jgi:hypothetical protein